MTIKQLLGWCGHPVNYGSIICDGCRHEANVSIASKKKKNRRKKVNG